MPVPLRLFVVLFLGVMVAACGRGPTHPRDGRDIDNLEIFRPALSPDGRFMVFDFYEYTTQPNDQALATRNHLALYDIEAETAQVLAPNDPMYSYNSASFAGDDQVLIAIQHCWSEACPPEDLGHQIVLLDLEGQRSRRVTDGRKPTHLWRDMGGQRPPEKRRKPIIRTQPVLVASESAVYYMGLWRDQLGASPSVGEHVTFPRRQLLRVDLRTGEESLAMTPESGAVEFRRYGRLALSGDQQLVFSGEAPSMGINTGFYHEIDAQAYLFDLVSRRLAPLFPSPPYFDESSGRPQTHRFTFRPLSLTSSADGQRIAFVDYSGGPGRIGVWLREDEEMREPLDLTAYGIRKAAFTALSADGRWLAILDDDSNRRFLLVDLDSGEVRELPLQVPLREAVEKARTGRAARLN